MVVGCVGISHVGFAVEDDSEVVGVGMGKGSISIFNPLYSRGSLAVGLSLFISDKRKGHVLDAKVWRFRVVDAAALVVSVELAAGSKGASKVFSAVLEKGDLVSPSVAESWGSSWVESGDGLTNPKGVEGARQRG